MGFHRPIIFVNIDFWITSMHNMKINNVCCHASGHYHKHHYHDYAMYKNNVNGSILKLYVFLYDKKMKAINMTVNENVDLDLHL